MRTILALCALLLCGCASYIQKRNINRLDGYSIRYPAEMAKLSNQLYPCFNGKAKSDTVITVKVDTVWDKLDTVIHQEGDSSTSSMDITHYFKGGTTNGSGVLKINTIKTIRITDTVQDQRALQACSLNAKVKADSLLIVKTQYATADKKATTYFWILVAIGAVVLGFTVIKVYQFVNGGFLTKL